jgi:selenocysteine-specific elongation factor
MKHVIIGTAGHVDHGKTTLIQALTGTNPDRLKEEQERGMTIDIGFAALKLPDGTIAGIVDVPGHERFLKNMLAGATGVDVVLLVIACDEGVMPQTREHLDVLRLLDVKNGVVALTKMDMVEKEWTDIIEEDVRAHLKDTFLADAPIIRVSATTGKGIEALKKALMAAVSRAEVRNGSLPFRLPIDRVFTRPGFGTVVTGTLVAGTMRVGDAVEIVPQQIATRVRGLQVHGQKVAEAEAGSRVAVNIAGVDTEALERGAQIATLAGIAPTTTFDAMLRLLPDAQKILEDRERVRVHLGTAEVLGRIRILDERGEMGPEDRGYVQFRGETEFACARGDRFVVRAYSPMLLMGGGIVLDAHPVRHRKADADALAALEAKERGTPEDLVETVLLRCPVGLLRGEVTVQSGLPASEAESTLEKLLADGRIVALHNDRVILTAILNAITGRCLVALDAYHKQFSLRAGIPREELRAALGKQVDAKAFGSLLSYWQRTELIMTEGASVRRPDFQVNLSERQQNMLGRIEEMYKTCDIATPSIEEVAQELKTATDAVTALLKVGQERGHFVRAEDGVYYHVTTTARLQQLVREYVEEHDSISVGAFRDLTHSNRKYALQALEYFDTIRFTRRQGDIRTLY